jgi:hypothetical protein
MIVTDKAHQDAIDRVIRTATFLEEYKQKLKGDGIDMAELLASDRPNGQMLDRLWADFREANIKEYEVRKKLQEG